MKFFQMVMFVVELLPNLIAMMKAAEAALPEKGMGKERLSMVRGLLEVLMASSGDLKVTFDQVWPMLDKTITVLVSTFNSSGVFAK